MCYLRIIAFAITYCFININASAQDIAENPAGDKPRAAGVNSNNRKMSTEGLPVFIGSLKKFLAKNVQYPEECIERHQEGRTLVEFTVLESGLIENIRLKESSGFSQLDKEAIRVTHLMEKKAYWKPAMQNGKAIRAIYTMPITFELIL